MEWALSRGGSTSRPLCAQAPWMKCRHLTHCLEQSPDEPISLPEKLISKHQVKDTIANE